MKKIAVIVTILIIALVLLSSCSQDEAVHTMAHQEEATTDTEAQALAEAEEQARLLAEEERARLEAEEAARIAEEEARAEAERKAEEEALRLAEEQAEAERLAQEQAEAEEQARIAAEEAKRLAEQAQQQAAPQAPPPASQAPEQPQQPAQSGATLDMGHISVDRFYSSGMTRAEVHADVDAILREVSGFWISSSGNITTDGANSSGLRVGTIPSGGFSIEVWSWRKETATLHVTISDTMKSFQDIASWAYGSNQVGKDLLTIVDQAETTNDDMETILRRNGFTDESSGTSGLGTLVHDATGARIRYDTSSIWIFYF